MKEGLTSVRITPRTWPFYVDPLKFLLIIELMPQNTKSQIAPASYNFLQSHCYISFGRASKHLWSFIYLLLLKSLTSVKDVKFTSSNWLIGDNIQILLINVSFPFDPNKAHMNVSEISQFQLDLLALRPEVSYPNCSHSCNSFPLTEVIFRQLERQAWVCSQNKSPTCNPRSLKKA